MKRERHGTSKRRLISVGGGGIQNIILSQVGALFQDTTGRLTVGRNIRLKTQDRRSCKGVCEEKI
jgi:hypothetical protein